MTWEPELDQLRRLRDLAAAHGGPERVRRHHAAGRLLVRERIDRLVDEGSFREVGSVAGFARYDDGELVDFLPANLVAGRATIEGRPVVVVGDDFTVRGGAADAAIHRKMVYAEQLALSFRIPLVRLVEGSGGGGSVKSYLELGRTYVPPLPGWRTAIDLLGSVPVLAAALGPVAGLGAARVVTSHHSVMVAEASQIFVAGPPVVAYATHEEVGKEELGGAQVQAGNGTVDVVVDSEDDAFSHLRRILSYLPDNVWRPPPSSPTTDPPDRRDERLADLVPRRRRRSYDVRTLIDAVVDTGSFLEVGARWGRPVVVGLARLSGRPVGIVAHDPSVWGGAVTAAASDKLRRHVDLCDTFNLPIVAFVDVPGFAVGTAAERAATIRHGAAAIAALYQASVPYHAVIVRRAFGVAGAALVDRGDPNVRVAWPSGDWGSLPLEGGIEAAYRRDLAAADDPDAMRDALLAEFESIRSPIRTAQAFDIEEIIDPTETRPVLCEWVVLAYGALRPGPSRYTYRP